MYVDQQKFNKKSVVLSSEIRVKGGSGQSHSAGGF